MRSLIGRLTIMYAVTLSVSLIVMFVVTMRTFDWFALAGIDRALLPTAQTVAGTVAFARGRLVVRQRDGEHLTELLAASGFSAALFALDGRPVEGLGSVPGNIRALVAKHPGKAALLSVGLHAHRLRVAVYPIAIAKKPRGYAAVWQREDRDGALDSEVQLFFALAAPLIVLTCLLLGGAIARRGLEPLDAMTRIASDIEATDLSARLRVGKQHDQLSRLATAFNRMLDRLGDAFARERRFTSDASHELRAPLAVIRATAEHALATVEDPTERQALRTIVLEVDELELLTRDLLAAARGEAGADDETAGRADLAEAVVGVTDELFPLARARGLRLSISAFDRADVDVAEATLVRVVRALVHNALNFAKSDVVIEVKRFESDVELHVCDDGPGFSPAALLHGTERFWRDVDSRGREQGNGLGLAIVAGLVKNVGGTLELSNRPEGGARVRVRFIRSRPNATATALPIGAIA